MSLSARNLRAPRQELWWFNSFMVLLATTAMLRAMAIDGFYGGQAGCNGCFGAHAVQSDMEVIFGWLAALFLTSIDTPLRSAFKLLIIFAYMFYLLDYLVFGALILMNPLIFCRIMLLGCYSKASS